MMNIPNQIINECKDTFKEKFRFIPFILLVLWSLDTFVSLFFTGFVRMDPWVLASIIFKCGIIGCNAYFIVNLIFNKRKDLFYFFKTCAGYCIVAVYVVYAFPRMSWELTGLITQAQAFRLWIFNFISTLFPFFLYLFFWLEKTQLAWGVETEKEIKAALKKKKKGIQTERKIKDIFIEYTHIIIQAFIIVILIQHFIFQLYVIPTESMVPTILTGDRPIVTKLQSGPAIPLTDWKLPVLIKPGRGNIVVFENPHYKQDSLFKKIFHHFVFLATLSLVDIDRDEQGFVRKRFIVKRVIGEPGDKLKMIDDQVFVKKKTDPHFTPLREDQDGYAHINLFSEGRDVVKQIKAVIITAQTRALLDRWDKKKNETRIPGLMREISEIIKATRVKFLSLHVSEDKQYILFLRCQRETKIIMESPRFNILSYLYVPNEIRKAEELAYISGIENENEKNVFHKYFFNNTFLSKGDVSGLSDYEINGKKLNLIFDYLVLSRFLRYVTILYDHPDITDINADPALSEISREISEFYIYIRYYDYRNFGEFPEGEGNYIPEGSYFLMGDNRYNSLDFRYLQNRLYLRKIDKTDQLSFVYPSNLGPYLLNEKKILGIVIGRLWPLNRFGLIK